MAAPFLSLFRAIFYQTLQGTVIPTERRFVLAQPPMARGAIGEMLPFHIPIAPRAVGQALRLP